MIAFDTARERILRRCRPLPAVTLPLAEAVGRYAARAVAARYPAPRFDQSAMDGYAVRFADVAAADNRTPAKLPIGGILPAGSARRPQLRAGTAWRVLTGGPLPRGTEAVVMQEECRVVGEEVLVTRAPERGENIRYRGEEYPRGASLIAAGARVTPPVVGLLATQGRPKVAVRQVPQVSVITIGDELVPVTERLRTGRIHESNGPALAAALAVLGIARCRRQLVPDDAAQIRAAVAAALRRSHVVITNAGVSVGDFDFVAKETSRLGIRRDFWRVAVKPGKPLLFGTWRGASAVRARGRATLFFGVPGNSVSTLVSFHLLIKPALLALAGAAEPIPVPVSAEITETYRKRRGRRHFLRGRLDPTVAPARATPLPAQGSHMLGALVAADCLIDVPADTTRLTAGQTVTVWPLRWDG